jgi:CheY-like chemotaxis protein
VDPERTKIEEQFQQAEAINARAGGIAHDLNNLLTVIGGYSKLIRATAKDLPAEIVESVSAIQNAAERAAILNGELLSITRRAGQSRPQEPLAAVSPPRMETILIVDDEPAVRKLMCEILRGVKYQVLEADGQEEALRILETYSNPIGLLITDVILSGTSGKSLAEHAIQIQPDIRVLFVSGYTDDVLGLPDLPQSSHPFLQKPFTPAILIEKVKEVLGGPQQNNSASQTDLKR